MTITDIAKLAGVSISTVSKVLNKKDDNIRPQTRERVLQIVKEYRYTPYGFVQYAGKTRNFFLGLVLPKNFLQSGILEGIAAEASKHGYQIQLCSFSSPEEELKCIRVLCSSAIDGVLWRSANTDSKKHAELFALAGIPMCFIDDVAEKPHEQNSNFIMYDYETVGSFAAHTVSNLKHTKICCFFDGANKAGEKIRSGIRNYLAHKQVIYAEFEYLPSLIFMGVYTACICCGWAKAFELYEYAQKYKIQIPQNLSVLCIDDKAAVPLHPSISSLKMNFSQFGQFAVNNLIERIDKNNPSNLFTPVCALTHKKTITVPQSVQNKKIIVVGSLNIDSILTVDEYPQTGKTLRARGLSMVPGGKGINQAVGIAKLNKQVSLLGKVGRDHDGSVILDLLDKNQIDVSGITIDELHPTGKAYIHVQEDGESGIVIYSGANRYITKKNIIDNENLFRNTAFCLLQTEIPLPIVQIAADTAKKHRIKIMLKPSAIDSLDEKLLSQIDYFIPNRKEFDVLCPVSGDFSQKADWFLQKGVGTVIVTLGSEGCYVKNNDCEKFFPAADFTPVDTTGAADAFIAALAVFLSENFSLEASVCCATYAAGFSTTKIGCVPALIDMAAFDKVLNTEPYSSMLPSNT